MAPPPPQPPPLAAAALHRAYPPEPAEPLGKRGRKPTDKKLAYEAEIVEEARPVRKGRWANHVPAEGRRPAGRGGRGGRGRTGGAPARGAANGFTAGGAVGGYALALGLPGRDFVATTFKTLFDALGVAEASAQGGASGSLGGGTAAAGTAGFGAGGWQPAPAAPPAPGGGSGRNSPSLFGGGWAVGGGATSGSASRSPRILALQSELFDRSAYVPHMTEGIGAAARVMGDCPVPLFR